MHYSDITLNTILRTLLFSFEYSLVFYGRKNISLNIKKTGKTQHFSAIYNNLLLYKICFHSLNQNLFLTYFATILHVHWIAK